MAETRTTTDLRGRSVLIAEDQFLIADEMCLAIERLGGRVIGPVASVAAALRLISEALPDMAVLDVDLNGERVYPVADALRAAGVPFVFTTGFDVSTMDPRFREALRLEKPIRMGTLARTLERLGGDR